MRWLVLAMLVPRLAAADFVIEEPGISYACPGGKTWSEVATCLGKQGKPSVMRAITGAKLVRLDQLENAVWVDGGLYLYVEQNGQWKAAGAFFGRDSDYEIAQLEPLTIGKHGGYRIDISQATQLFVQIDGLTTQRAIRRAAQTMFCSALTTSCLHVTRACEVLVFGGAYWTFRGKLNIAGNDVTITGDRRSAGPYCAQAERVFLGWPQE